MQYLYIWFITLILSGSPNGIDFFHPGPEIPTEVIKVKEKKREKKKRREREEEDSKKEIIGIDWN